MAYVNLIDIVWPVGSLYFTTSTTSPSTTFGGSWTQIKGAVMAATGANNFATNAYGGKLAIQATQLPQHAHCLGYNTKKSEISSWSNQAVDDIDDCGGYVNNLGNILPTLKVFQATANGRFTVYDGNIYYHSGSTTSGWVSCMYATQLLLGGGAKFSCLTIMDAILGDALHKIIPEGDE